MASVGRLRNDAGLPNLSQKHKEDMRSRDDDHLPEGIRFNIADALRQELLVFGTKIHAIVGEEKKRVTDALDKVLIARDANCSINDSTPADDCIKDVGTGFLVLNDADDPKIADVTQEGGNDWGIDDLRQKQSIDVPHQSMDDHRNSVESGDELRLGWMNRYRKSYANKVTMRDQRKELLRLKKKKETHQRLRFQNNLSLTSLSDPSDEGSLDRNISWSDQRALHGNKSASTKLSTPSDSKEAEAKVAPKSLADDPEPMSHWPSTGTNGSSFNDEYLGWTPLRHAIDTTHVDYLSASLIVLNAITIGASTNYVAANLSTQMPLFYVVTEKIFCWLFTLELALRIYAYRRHFFIGYQRNWNLFDCLVVGLQLFEEIVTVIAAEGGNDSFEDGIGGGSFSIMRLLRILRLIRIIRLVRVMHLVNELRSIIVSIFSSIQALMWTLLLLFLIMYMCGVYITQLVSDHLIENPESPGAVNLQWYFGSLGRTILSLYQGITGGLDWENLVDPLMAHVSEYCWIPICFYIGFVIFTLMNVVTGVFVESSLRSVDKDREMVLMHHAKHMFSDVDEDESGEISFKEFTSRLRSPMMDVYFRNLDIDKSDAEDLFHLIDIDNSGAVDWEEFINGCLRLRGPAKAIDLAAFQHDFKRLSTEFQRHVRNSERVFKYLVSQSRPALHDAEIDVQRQPST